MKEGMKNIVELEISKPITRFVRVVFPTKHPKEVVVEWLKSIHKSSTFDEYNDNFGFTEEDIDEGDVWEVEPHTSSIYETPNEKPEDALDEPIFDEEIQKWIDEKEKGTITIGGV